MVEALMYIYILDVIRDGVVNHDTVWYRVLGAQIKIRINYNIFG
jgi:hypothetical protein